VDAIPDPETQPERTRLAWRRTTLTFTLVVVLAGRKVALADDGRGLAVVVVALEALLWVAFLVLAQLRIRGLEDDRGPAPTTEATMLGAAGVIAVSALLGAVLLAAPV
jgi:uncharacterized protein DUF202